MNAIVLLFSLGIVLLALEVFMPGAVIGVIGGCAMAGGCMVSFSRFGAGSGMLATFIAFVLLGAALYAEFVLLPKTRFGRKLFVHATVSSTSQAPLATAEAVVGKSGVALTTLAPSGYVLVEGKRYEAFSQSGHIPKGAALHVVNLDNFRLIVSKT